MIIVESRGHKGCTQRQGSNSMTAEGTGGPLCSQVDWKKSPSMVWSRGFLSFQLSLLPSQSGPAVRVGLLNSQVAQRQSNTTKHQNHTGRFKNCRCLPLTPLQLPHFHLMCEQSCTTTGVEDRSGRSLLPHCRDKWHASTEPKFTFSWKSLVTDHMTHKIRQICHP